MTDTLIAGLASALMDRDGGGRFAPGNRGGPGNPFARQMAAFRAVIFRVVQPQDVEKAVRKLVELAGDGYFPAIKLLLQYTLGKPTAPEPDQQADQEPADVSPRYREPTPAPSTNGSAVPERGDDAPSTNGERQCERNDGPAANDVTPSTNDESDTTATPTAPAQAEPSTNGMLSTPPGGNVRKKRLLTAGLHPKRRE